MQKEFIKTDKRGSSGIAFTGECVFYGVYLGMDGANNCTLTIYDGLTNAGTEILPTVEYDSLALGINGIVLPKGRLCYTGLYVEITCAGTVEVVTLYQDRALLGVG